MRGTTLAAMRLMLRSEIGQTMQTAIATQGDAQLNQMLSNKQVWLSAMYDWPFLENRWDLVVPPATRYIALPTTPNVPNAVANTLINFDRPVLVESQWTRLWRPLRYGIGSAEYNTTNSDLGLGRDPIQCWQMSTNTTDATANMIEVWPVPVTQQTMRFTGQRILGTLYGSDANKAELDDLLLVYMVAADYLTFHKNPAATMKVSLARDRLTQLRSDYQQNDRTVVLGRGFDKNRRSKRLLNIAVAGDNAGSGSDDVGIGIGIG